MKKFLPYILITTFVATFLMLSFSLSFLGSFEATNKAEAAEETTKEVVKTSGAEALTKSLEGREGADTSGWGAAAIADWTAGKLLSWISDFTMTISRFLFNASAFLMDSAIDFSIRDFKKNIEGIGMVEQGYKIVLDVANMIFIFLLLYISIKTILGLGGDTKKLLTNIIVVALMINFSLFMTRAIIDGTNILAMGFYNGIYTKTENSNQTIESTGSVATSMMAGLRFSSLLPSKNSKFISTDNSKGLSNFNIAIVNFGGSVFLVIAAFVFFSVAILFILRFITLLFYMIFSPVAFLGYISPEMKQYSSKWWKGLLSQAQFAPIFMLSMYVISAMINSKALTKLTGDGTFYDDISSGFTIGFSSILNFVILIGLMLGALVAAKASAKVGSDVGFGYAQKLQGWAQGMAGRNTLGRGAYLAGNNRYMAKLMAKSPTLGNFAKTQFDNVAGQKFGSKIGYEASLKKSIAKKKKMGEFVGKAKVGKTDEFIRTENGRLDKMKPLKELKENADKTKKEVERLKKLEVDMKASGSWTKADADAAQLALENLQRDEALLENRIGAESRVKDLASLQEKMKKEYAKNLGYAAWGLGPLDKIFRSGADAAAEIRKGKSKGEKEVAEMVEKLVEEKAKEE